MVTDHLVCVDICPYGTFLCYQWNWIRLDESFLKSYHLLYSVKINPAYGCNEKRGISSFFRPKMVKMGHF